LKPIAFNLIIIRIHEGRTADQLVTRSLSTFRATVDPKHMHMHKPYHEDYQAESKIKGVLDVRRSLHVQMSLPGAAEQYIDADGDGDRGMVSGDDSRFGSVAMKSLSSHSGVTEV
jgi:hypothetical protein